MNLAKPALALLLPVIVSAFPLLAQDAPKPADPFEEGMRQAFNAYKNGNHEAVASKLRELLAMMDEKGAAKIISLLPDVLGDWKGEGVKRDDPGVGAVSRAYISGGQRITVRIVKDSPLVGQLLPLFVNEDLLRMANRKVHKFGNETGVMEGENKLQIVADQRIYVELEGEGGAGEAELAALAGKLDMPGIAKIK